MKLFNRDKAIITLFEHSVEYSGELEFWRMKKFSRIIFIVPEQDIKFKIKKAKENVLKICIIHGKIEKVAAFIELYSNEKLYMSTLVSQGEIPKFQEVVFDLNGIQIKTDTSSAIAKEIVECYNLELQMLRALNEMTDFVPKF